MIILAADHFLEQVARVVAPEELFQSSGVIEAIAKSGLVDGIAAFPGTAMYIRELEPSVPIILKVAGRSDLYEGRDEAPTTAYFSITGELLTRFASKIRNVRGVALPAYFGSAKERESLAVAGEFCMDAYVSGYESYVYAYAIGDEIVRLTDREKPIALASAAAALGATHIKVHLDIPWKKVSASWIETIVKAGAPSKVLIAGGDPVGAEEFIDAARKVADGGAHGMVIGRNLLTRSPEEAVELLQELRKIFGTESGAATNGAAGASYEGVARSTQKKRSGRKKS